MMKQSKYVAVTLILLGLDSRVDMQTPLIQRFLAAHIPVGFFFSFHSLSSILLWQQGHIRGSAVDEEEAG